MPADVPTPGSQPRRLAIGIDVGTSSVKATVITSDGETRSYQSTPYGSTSSVADGVEQNPDDWWAAVVEVLDALLADFADIGPATTVIGLTGQMHTSVLIDSGGRVIRPAMLWSDKRAVAECAALTLEVPEIAEIIGNSVMPAFTVAHLAWVRKHEPDAYARIARVLVPKDEIRRRLGAGVATEPSDASGTGILNFTTDEWSTRILDAIGLSVSVMPMIIASHATSGVVTVHAGGPAQHFDRLLGVPIVGGAGDQAAQAVALGIDSPGHVGISIGTSGVAFVALDEPRLGAFRHAFPNQWLSLDSTHAAGLALSWLSRLTGVPVPQLAEQPAEAETAPIFLPYLQGHRDQAGAPGSLVGLEANHQAGDIAYAVMEGVAYELVRLAETVGIDALPPGPVHLGGGGGRSTRWRQLLANALGRPVLFSDRDSSFGAAALGAQSAGWYGRFEANDSLSSIEALPDASLSHLTSTRRSRFNQSAEALAALA